MNCDQVFDILTRGPFPSGDESDAAVERHLAACHDCRQLAEALRPAVDLWHESLAADENDCLPGYRGALLRPAEQRISLAVAEAIEVLPRRRRRVEKSNSRRLTDWRPGLFRLAAGVMLAASLVVLLLSVVGTGGMSGGGAGDGAIPTTTTAFEPGSSGRQLLASLRIEESHWYRTDARLGGQAKTVHCCTRCHAQGSTAAAPLLQNQFARLQSSCRACHES